MNPALIVALDVPSGKEMEEALERLPDRIEWYKVGLELFCAEGPNILVPLKKRNKKIFLDLKLHDIPNTVANAVIEAASHGIDMLTLHTLGGMKMMRRANEVLEGIKKNGQPVPQLLGVTVLTSMDTNELENIGFNFSIPDLVLKLALLAQETGMDGLVCSPKELTRLQEEGIRDLFFVTPGIRPSGASADDQKRITTPQDAISMGARHRVWTACINI